MTEPADLTDMQGWIFTYREAEKEREEWAAAKKAWDKKWKPFLEPFKEKLYTELEKSGTDTGTVDGKPVIKVKENKVAGHEVKAHVRRQIVLIEEEEDQE